MSSDEIRGRVDRGENANIGKDINSASAKTGDFHIYTGGVRPEDATLADIMRVLVGDARFDEIGLVRRFNNVQNRLGQVESRLSSVEGRLDAVETDLTSIAQLIEKRWGAGRIIISPLVAIALAIAFAAIAVGLAFMIYLNARGGSLDGQFGAAISYLFRF